MTMTNLERLSRVPLFAGLGEESLTALAAVMTERIATQGEWLFQQGDAGDRLFVVVTGTLEAVIDAGLESERAVTTFGPGDFFGEMALLTGAPRSAAVRATSSARLLSLGKTEFDAVVGSNPRIALQLSRVLSSRLASTNEQLAGHATGPIVVIPVGDATVLDPVLAATEASIARQSTRVREPLVVARTPTVEAVAPLLRRGSDVWLLAASAADLATATPLAGQLRDARHRVRAAYLGARGEPFPNFAESPFPPVRVTRDSRPGEHLVDSFARALIGATIGVALSGGAAQGTAHVGVLEALVDAGIPIDLIAGTSGGALYGSLVASGLTVQEARARVIHNTRKNLRDRSDYTLPRTGLLRGAAIERMIHESTNGARFEDLHFPLYTVAADLATGEEVVVERGPVSHGVRASISVPGIFEPFTVDGRVLVDGGVVNPLPVSVCRARGANYVIACSVPAPGKLKQGSAQQSYNIVSVIMRSYYFAGDVIANANAADADVLIKPAVEGFGWRDYKSSPQIIAAGREAGEAALGRIRARLGASIRV